MQVSMNNYKKTIWADVRCSVVECHALLPQLFTLRDRMPIATAFVAKHLLLMIMSSYLLCECWTERVAMDRPYHIEAKTNGRHFPDDIFNAFSWMEMY